MPVSLIFYTGPHCEDRLVIVGLDPLTGSDHHYTLLFTGSKIVL